MRKEGRRVSTTLIKLKAESFCIPLEITNFKGSNSGGIDLCIENNRCLRFKYIQHSQVGNMDKVPMSFDLPSNFTVETKGKENVNIVITEAEKCKFTVNLADTADSPNFCLCNEWEYIKERRLK
ncbi:hypothetical protein BB558_006003 [Smittium angustum]|uniref:Uncharacterized protein n=1 Tax=Smittium angustum TaxID=133377 RepID=A0A2U1IYW1_SMIAN|nr:hypothetical protein BB558_006003 [Smittium angustum]